MGEHLSTILRDIQILDARLRGISCEPISEDSIGIYTRPNIVDYMYSLGVLQARVNNMFEFSRGLCEFESSPVTSSNIYTALGNVAIVPERYPPLPDQIRNRTPE